MTIKPSELILNSNGSIYHLNLKPEHIAKTIIFVGDQDRVEKITRHFESIEYTIQKREFKTQTGLYKGKRLTVMSTGIGPDNIDIVLNELDALVNIDLNERKVKDQLASLNIIRVGTSGSLQADIPVDSFVLGTHGLDLSGMLNYYALRQVNELKMEEAFMKHTHWNPNNARPIIVRNGSSLEAELESELTFKGITATAGGFYGPQGRVLRLPLQSPKLNSRMDCFEFGKYRMTNFEMETSAIYGLSKLLGHNAVSLNAIIANRANGTFSADPKKAVEKLISYVLGKIAKSKYL